MVMKASNDGDNETKGGHCEWENTNGNALIQLIFMYNILT